MMDMPSLEQLVKLVLQASWQGAVLIVMVLGIQWALGSRLQPRWRYGLWLLVMLRLVLPGTVPSNTSVFNLLSLQALFVSPPVVAGGSPATVTIAPEAEPAEPDTQLTGQRASNAIPLGQIRTQGISWLLCVWLAGSAGLAACVCVAHRKLWRQIKSKRPLINPDVLNLLEDCKEQMGVRTPVALLETSDDEAPCLAGFVRPRMLLPAGMTRNFSLQELRYVFLHELGHVKRHDVLLGWAMTLLQVVHWFNPLVWVASYRMRVDRELACDALALSYGSEAEKQPYGDTIIKLLESFGRPVWVPSLAAAVENRHQLKERIRMIAKFKPQNRAWAFAMALFAALGLVTLTDARPGASPSSKDLVGAWILIGVPGEVGQPPAVGGRLKVFTENTWSVTQADPNTGVTIWHHGGTYDLKGDQYTEHIDYANESTKQLIGKTPKFTIKVEGETFTQSGNGLNEVWKRVTPETLKARKDEPGSLQGKWQGREAGAKGSFTLVIQDSTLEAHSADSNEWFKASFALYATTPKQMVLTVKDCASPEYVGRTAFAIYELRNGTLTITGNEPGFPASPADFDASGARKIVFKKE